MKIMLLGSPGVGKGTQAALICDYFSIPQISTGNILRAAIESGSELGLLAKSCLDEGRLVPDNIVIDIVRVRLAEADCAHGFLLDGFPRTIAQAQALIDAGVHLDHVVALDVSIDEVVKRLSGRRMHLASGRTYHVDYNPPKIEGVDDLTAEPLIQRNDDKEQVVRKRLDVYHEQTLPLINFYQQLAENKQVNFASIPGVGVVTDVNKKVMMAIGE